MCVFPLKEELLAMKQRVRVVVVENEKLHEELKAKMVEDTLKEFTLLDGTVLLFMYMMKRLLRMNEYDLCLRFLLPHAIIFR